MKKKVLPTPCHVAPNLCGEWPLIELPGSSRLLFKCWSVLGSCCRSWMCRWQMVNVSL